jgi:hypothetical protein
LIDRKEHQRGRRSDNASDFRRVFIVKVHQLLELGYRKLIPRDWEAAEEPAITGELVRGMEEVASTSKPFRHFHVHDDPYVNAPGRLGKHRKKLDISVVSSQNLQRTRFSFEAKRLGPLNPVRNYVGPEGLGCFLRGDYAATEDEAGMLGYVQSDTAENWAQRIQAKLQESRATFALYKNSTWREHLMRSGPTNTYHTCHNRAALGRSIDIYHTFLVFH